MLDRVGGVGGLDRRAEGLHQEGRLSIKEVGRTFSREPQVLLPVVHFLILYCMPLAAAAASSPLSLLSLSIISLFFALCLKIKMDFIQPNTWLIYIFFFFTSRFYSGFDGG